MAKVEEIQVCGGDTATTLIDACLVYIQAVDQDTDREKLNFSIILDDGTTKHITFRQENDGIHVYGDFEGMPNFLEWSRKMFG